VTSPFLAIPESEHVASNALAFAVRDAYPVSPGHTLVVPRRLVETFFDASEEERAAIFALVDEVKAALDARDPRPDGYNVGFNAGEAAGQTVMHLHVHVIPRYRGDMDDPRGGVRHVIPSKGNYLNDARPLATGGEADPFARHVLPPGARAEAERLVEALMARPPEERWLESRGRRAKVVAVTPRGGLRIAGEGGAFHERTVSLTDLAWVGLARRDAVARGGPLDEARVNRLRYLEGTPKSSTRYIDTAWAIAAWERA